MNQLQNKRVNRTLSELKNLNQIKPLKNLLQLNLDANVYK
jgi:hypothetical protein